MTTEKDSSVRLDVWLWRARFYKTRKLSSEHISKKGVRISRNGQVRRTTKPGTTITVGDIVTFGKSVHIRSVEVLELGTRRGPAKEAQGLYIDWESET
ncbi:MAG: RNA-binding S4 domain-containing protein [Pseudomonadota bacterium]